VQRLLQLVLDGLADRVTGVGGDLAGRADQRADQLGPLVGQLPQRRTGQLLLRPAQLLALTVGRRSRPSAVASRRLPAARAARTCSSRAAVNSSGASP
jgi:hypothetical protein